MSALAADPTDPEWPCVQRKVPHLSIGQMWAGPPIDEAMQKSWREDDAVGALAPALAARRTSTETAEALIAEFAAGSGDGPAREKRLAMLFAGVFSLIEQERSTILNGIGRYARKQTALSESIEKKRDALTDLRAVENPSHDQLDEIDRQQDAIDWDTRIYHDRAQSLTYVCETPVILERRAFAMARAIAARLE